MSEPTYEQLERICEAFLSSFSETKVEGVTILDKHRVNAANWRFDGVLTDETGEWYFAIADGDYGGTEVLHWSDNNEPGPTYDVVGEEPERMVLVPRDEYGFRESKGKQAVFRAWMKETWFTEMERSYNYDQHFQPGNQVESHYRETAGKRGLVWAFESERVQLLKDIKEEVGHE